MGGSGPDIGEILSVDRNCPSPPSNSGASIEGFGGSLSEGKVLQ